MKYFAICLAVIVATDALPARSLDDLTRPSTREDAIVTLPGDTLTYIGGVSDQGLRSLNDAIRDVPRGRITKMIVDSGGGDTEAGIAIGAIVADVAPALTVEIGCFSS